MTTRWSKHVFQEKSFKNKGCLNFMWKHIISKIPNFRVRWKYFAPFTFPTCAAYSMGKEEKM